MIITGVYIIPNNKNRFYNKEISFTGFLQISSYINRSNLSFPTLHMGHVSGGSSRAHKYPQTLHLHTGREREVIISF